MTLATITPLEVEMLGRYIYELCGILMDQSKAYLLESRLGPFRCQIGNCWAWMNARGSPLRRQK